MNYTKIVTFLAFAFGFSIIGLNLPALFFQPDSDINMLLLIVSQALLYSWGPALATIVTQKYIYKESMARYG